MGTAETGSKGQPGWIISPPLHWRVPWFEYYSGIILLPNVLGDTSSIVENPFSSERLHLNLGDCTL